MVHEDRPLRISGQVMGNDYYGGNEQLLLPDNTTVRGEDVLGWYLITLRYYRRYYKPVMHTETNVFDPDAAPRWLWKQWTNVLRMRRDGVPVLGFTWYSLIDQLDWDSWRKGYQSIRAYPAACALPLVFLRNMTAITQPPHNRARYLKSSI